MATTTVFIDDAVRGRLPDVCAKDGVPAGGDRMTMRREIGATNRLGIAWLLIFAGPLGWLVLLFLSSRDQGEYLTITLPFSEAAYQRYRDAKRARRVSGWGLFLGGAALVVLAVSLESTPLAIVGFAGVFAAAIAVLVGDIRVDRTVVDFDLDASRRWLTISRVDPAFAQACASQEAAAEARRP
jgi:hypothetical protein